MCCSKSARFSWKLFSFFFNRGHADGFQAAFPELVVAVDIFHRHQKTVGQKGEEKELHPYNLPPFTDNKARRLSEREDGGGAVWSLCAAIMPSVAL